MDNRAIGVFDSGLGGLTVVRELMREMPGESIIYFGDTGRVPYGNRGEDIIKEYARQDIRFLTGFDIKAIVVACGTVSSVALPEIAGDYSVPIIGVVQPAAQYAAKLTKNGKIGIIGTAATIKNGLYYRILKSVNPEFEIFQTACPLFVPLAENGYQNKEAARLIAADYLHDIKSAGVDILILGCTHYPLLTETIRGIMGEGVSLVNIGVPAARYVHGMLSEKDALSGKPAEYHYFVSDMTEEFTALAETFLELDRPDIKKIDINKY